MKRLKSFLCLMCGAVFSLMLVGCGNKKHTLSFYVDGVVFELVESSGNEKIVLENEPTKEGYTFDGWFLDEEYTQAFDMSYFFEKDIESDLKIYSKWNINEYKIIYHSNFGSDETNEETFTIEDSVVAKNNNMFERDGFVFAGWNTSSDGTGTMIYSQDIIELEVYENVNLYAVWVDVQMMTIKFDVNETFESLYQIYYVDLNQETELSLIVTPDVLMEYALPNGVVTYSIHECSAQNKSRFSLINGTIKVTSEYFEPIIVKATFNGKVATCIVSLAND